MTDGATILLVEDNADDVFFMKRAFRTAGINNPIQIANNGQAAIDYLAGNGEFVDRAKYPLPCLVLLDLKLPGINGHEVLQWIREQENLETLVVLMLTTSRENRDIEEAYRLGCNAFLVKPSAPPKLIELVAALKQFWLVHNTLPA
jgi:CheY-like chemotaxis protein